MGKHYVKNIDIIKFKCFDNFSLSDFSRVNLIGGKNNVGKTAFMEAVCINVYSQNIEAFATAISDIKFMRENMNILLDDDYFDDKKLMEATNIYKSISNISNVSFEILQNQMGQQYLFNVNSDETTIESNKFSFKTTIIDNVDFIGNFGWSDSEIVSAYSSVQKNDKEDYLNKIINKFDNRIDSFSVTDSKPLCKVNDKYVEITEFGDGLQHFISIVCAMFKCENGYLFIDKIDNSIHYTQLDKIWKIIFEVSKKLRCQIFATTNSKDMIESFTKTLIKHKDKKVSFIELGLKDNEVKALVYDHDMIVYEAEQNNFLIGNSF
jgi:AAA15 family ATPase/GTPase